MRIGDGIRGGLVPVVVSLVVLELTLIRPTPANAHCPGTAAHDYAYGNQGLAFNVNGVNAQISWTKGNVCTSGVSHSVSVCSAGSCSKWAQAGWRYYSGYANPLMYCEWGGGTYKIMDFALSAATHTYQQRFDAPSSEWDCTLDGAVKVFMVTARETGQMHTDGLSRAKGLIAVIAVTAIAVVAGLLSSQALMDRNAGTDSSGPTDSAALRLPDLDRSRLDMAFGQTPEAAIAASQALSVMREHYDPDALGAQTLDVFLESVTVEGTFRTDAPLRERSVWIVRLTGMTQEQAGPVGEDGLAGEIHTLRNAYVFVDAKTAAFLFTIWTE
ncbi:MAG TPA: hypothetical protein VJ975_06325 [Candidatus Limnocylindria bacterium]|nr:hypothetical protein [Candidatus Limnocylindria bacterium]